MLATISIHKRTPKTWVVLTLRAALLWISVVPGLTDAAGIMVVHFAVRIRSAVTRAHAQLIDARLVRATFRVRHAFDSYRRYNARNRIENTLRSMSTNVKTVNHNDNNIKIHYLRGVQPTRASPV